MATFDEREAQRCYEQAWKRRQDASDLFRRVSECLKMENLGVFERNRYKLLLKEATEALEASEWYDRQRALYLGGR